MSVAHGKNCDIKFLENKRRCWTRKNDHLEEMSSAYRKSYLDPFSVQGRLLRKDLITVWSFMHNLSPLLQDKFFSPAPDAGTRTA